MQNSLVKKIDQYANLSQGYLGNSDYQNLPVSFSKKETEVVLWSIESKDNPALKDLSFPELITLSTAIFKTANARFGNSNKNESHATETIKLVVSDLKKFPLLKQSEILAALEMGLDGEFEGEEVKHFSSVGFVKWIKSYIEFKKPIMKKKAQYDHQSLAQKNVSEQEEKSIIEQGFAWHVKKIEDGENIASFEGLDAVFERCEKLNVFTPLDFEEKTAIFQECQKLCPRHTKEQLVVLARKVAYLYVVCQAAMQDYTIESLIQTVRKSEMNTLEEKERIDFYRKYKQNKNENDEAI